MLLIKSILWFLSVEFFCRELKALTFSFTLQEKVLRKEWLKLYSWDENIIMPIFGQNVNQETNITHSSKFMRGIFKNKIEKVSEIGNMMRCFNEKQEKKR